MLDTVESRWGKSIDRLFDTPASLEFRPDPSLWVAFLNAGASRNGHVVPPLGRAPGPVVPVWVNHGVWQTVCPYCPSAQHASRDDRWFFCAHCHNEPDRLMLPVVWPADADEIEALLLQRPLKENRNWRPGETAADLRLENARYLETRS